jgi:proteic killer suppression protein
MPIEISFANTKLRDLCEQEKVARRNLGDLSAKKLKTRLADLRAASHVGELVAGRPHPLKGDRLGQLALDLHGADRLVIKAENDPIPMLQGGAVDWAQVDKVQVVFVGNYHD